MTFRSWPDLVLASASPRRLDLLRAAGAEPRVCHPPEGSEREWSGEPADTHVRAQSHAKAAAVLSRERDAFVVGADTVVVLDEHVLEKPRDDAHACAMLRALSGRTHSVLTAVSVAHAAHASIVTEVEQTAVTFHDIEDAEIAAYVASGEPLDKAGAYAIQGRGGVFVRKIDGCYFNVVGLPIPRLYRMLRALWRS